MLVQTRRDKAPHLMQNKKRGQQHGNKQSQLERRQKRRGYFGGDHAAVFGQKLDQRCGGKAVDIVREVKQRNKNDQNDTNNPQQSIAQLKQMLHQGQLVVSGQIAHVFEELLLSRKGAASVAGASLASVPVCGVLALSVSAFAMGASVDTDSPWA